MGFAGLFVRLTDEVWLRFVCVEDDEADHAGQGGDDAERESEVDCGFVVFAHAGEEEEGEGVDLGEVY